MGQPGGSGVGGIRYRADEDAPATPERPHSRTGFLLNPALPRGSDDLGKRTIR